MKKKAPTKAVKPAAKKYRSLLRQAEELHKALRPQQQQQQSPLYRRVIE